MNLIELFWSKVGVSPSTECWLWTGAKTPKGYGRFQRAYAHRFAYEMWRELIPRHLQIDHICRNRACVNVWHMEAVSCHVNVHRGVGPAAKNARKARCLNGHRFDARTRLGYRRCTQCQRERDRIRNAKKIAQ